MKNKHLALKVPGLRYNGHCEFKKKSKFYWLPAMTNLDLDQQKQWPYKFSLTEIQAAAGYLLLRRLDKLNQVRVSRAKKFIKTLKKFPELSFNSDYEKNRHVYHLLSAMIISKDFNSLTDIFLCGHACRYKGVFFSFCNLSQKPLIYNHSRSDLVIF